MGAARPTNARSTTSGMAHPRSAPRHKTSVRKKRHEAHVGLPQVGGQPAGLCAEGASLAFSPLCSEP